MRCIEGNGVELLVEHGPIGIGHVELNLGVTGCRFWNRHQVLVISWGFSPDGVTAQPAVVLVPLEFVQTVKVAPTIGGLRVTETSGSPQAILSCRHGLQPIFESLPANVQSRARLREVFVVKADVKAAGVADAVLVALALGIPRPSIYHPTVCTWVIHRFVKVFFDPTGIQNWHQRNF